MPRPPATISAISVAVRGRSNHRFLVENTARTEIVKRCLCSAWEAGVRELGLFEIAVTPICNQLTTFVSRSLAGIFNRYMYPRDERFSWDGGIEHIAFKDIDSFTEDVKARNRRSALSRM